MSRRVLSAFSDEYADSFEEQLAGMNRFGIEYIELRHVNGKNVSLLTEAEGREVKRMLDQAGIRVSAVGSPLGKIPLDGDRKAHLDSAKRIFSLAELLGAKFVRTFSFYPSRGRNVADQRTEVFTAVEELLLAAREYPVTLCHENEAGIYGDTPLRCRDLLDHFGGELKCVFDMGNFVLEQIRPYPDAYETLKPEIAYFHIKDALSRGAVVPPGRGEAGIREILKAHEAFSSEDFFVSLEPHLQTFSGKNALVGRSFENPYQYPDGKSAFADAVEKFRELTL